MGHIWCVLLFVSLHDFDLRKVRKEKERDLTKERKEKRAEG
jgi:hypothetical protein